MSTLVKRSQIIAWLNITPSAQNPSWGLIGNGVTDLSYDYGAQESTETYIVDDNASTTVDGYQVALDTEMKCMKGDDVYDFVNTLRYNLSVGSDAETKVLLVDKYEPGAIEGTYKAQTYNCSVSIGNYGGPGGESPTISYKINCNGTPTQGTVAIANGIPTFTPATASI